MQKHHSVRTVYEIHLGFGPLAVVLQANYFWPAAALLAGRLTGGVWVPLP